MNRNKISIINIVATQVLDKVESIRCDSNTKFLYELIRDLSGAILEETNYDIEELVSINDILLNNLSKGASINEPH